MKRVEPQAVECPLCGASSWEPCHDERGKHLRDTWHPSRRRVAASYGEPQRG